ncbi:MAG: pantoate kinase [Candidatus Nezhaarchaeales archaeon]
MGFRLNREIEVSVWVPCHITCFFEIRRHESALETGSRGAGLNLDIGVETCIRISPSEEVGVNGGNEVSKDVAERVLKSLGVKARIEVSHRSEVPMGAGYGVSGATALGSALALSIALGNVMTVLQAGAIAHVVEVEHLTGLGDVIAQIHGGIEIRVKEGAPGIGVIDWIPHDQDLRVIVVTLRSIPTREVLEGKVEVVNRCGLRALSNLLKRPNVRELMDNAKIFAEEVGFMNGDLKDLAKMMVEEGAIGASVKKGVLYVLTRRDNVDKLHDVIANQLKGRQIITCGISNHGPKVIRVKGV